MMRQHQPQMVHPTKCGSTSSAQPAPYPQWLRPRAHLGSRHGVARLRAWLRRLASTNRGSSSSPGTSENTKPPITQQLLITDAEITPAPPRFLSPFHCERSPRVPIVSPGLGHLGKTTTTPTVNPVLSTSTSDISTTTSPEPTNEPPELPKMAAERTLQQIITQLKSNPSLPYNEASSLLSKAKLSLLQLNALTPTANSPSNLLLLARSVYEHGALASIRARNPDAFTRYLSQLQPFYELPSSQLKPDAEMRNKVTGLYLLLLLTQGRYAEFHSELESLGTREGIDGPDRIESDRFLGYPVKLERWLMEGSYDRVWKAMKKGEVPSEEYGVFSEVRYATHLNSKSPSKVCSTVLSANENTYIDPDIPNPIRNRFLFRARIPVFAS